jgi:short-subunit dehydrogenase
MSLAGKRYWLVGASEGLGLALAKQMHAAGARLVLSARNAARLEAICRTLPGSETASHIVRLMESSAFKKSFPTVFSWLFRLSQFLPDWAYYPLFAPKK